MNCQQLLYIWGENFLMALYAQLQEDYKTAFKAKEKISKEILNFVIASLKNKQIELQKELTDDDVIKVIKKEIKMREETIWFMEQGGDAEGVVIEKAKIAIIEKYLPATMSEADVRALVEKTIATLNITDIQKQKGMLIGSIMKEHGSNIDGWLLQKVVHDFTPSS